MKSRYESDTIKELRKTTGLNKRPSQSLQYYYRRLVYAAAALPDEQWETLSSRTQIWVRKSANALNKDKPLPKFPDDKIIQQRKYIDAKTATKHRKQNFKNGKPASSRVMEILLDYGVNLQADEIVAILRSEGYKYSKPTASLVKNEFRRALKVLTERGLLTTPVTGITSGSK